VADPRLNSVHLDPPRRKDYRRARAVLLNARGWQTIAAEQFPGNFAAFNNPNTLIQNLGGERPPPGLKFWLTDGDFVYPLKVGLNTIGRSPDNDVVLPDAYVSRRHCAILVHAGDGCELHDTASKNGTFLNGRKVPGPTHLQTGDEIRMCDRQLVFMTGDEAKAGPAQSPTQTGS